MNYSIDNVLKSIARVIHKGFPDYKIYISAVPQGVTIPCFFISFMPSTSRSQVDNRIYSELGLDIVFLMKPNEINATSLMYQIVEYLDENLEMIPYYEGQENTGVIHTYERNSHMEDMDLHYQVTIKARGHIEVAETLMEELEAINYEIKVS
jgi:hypothetical protein